MQGSDEVQYEGVTVCIDTPRPDGAGRFAVGHLPCCDIQRGTCAVLTLIALAVPRVLVPVCLCLSAQYRIVVSSSKS